MRILLFLIFTVLIASCIEAIVFDTEGAEGPMAVYGIISDQPESSFVSVGRSVPYDNESFKTLAILPLSGANITVEDSEGNTIGFSQSNEIGRHEPNDLEFRGVIGRKYKVSVFLNDGNSYESAWEEMVSVPQIDKLEIRPFQRNSLKNGIEITNRGVEVSAVINDPSEVPNYYRWRWFGVYEIQYSLDNNGPCWVTEPDPDDLIIFSDDELNGEVLNIPIIQIGYNGRVNIQNKYVITVEQQSMTSGAYEYHRQVQEQRRSQGTLFDPTPAPIRGNIYSIENKTEVVVGYFLASSSSISRRTIESVIANSEEFINCDDFLNQRRIPGFCFDCAEIARATRNKPEWY